MKFKKRLLSLIVVLCTLVCGTSTVFAAEATETPNYGDNPVTSNIPEDAIILYEGDNGIVYQSVEKESELKTTRSSLEYNGVTVHNDTTGNFSIKDPNAGLFSTTYGTVKVEGGSSGAYATIEFVYSYLGMMSTIGGKKIYPSYGDVYFSFNNMDTYCTVQYDAITNSNMTINCWLYTDRPSDFDSRPKL